MIDTHAHIFLEDFKDDLVDVVARAKTAGVEKILLPDIDSTTTEMMVRVTDQFVDCLPMIGLHPCSVREDYVKELAHVKENLERGGYIAVGEIGTDLYWDKTYWEQQQHAFNAQCELALAHQLPVVIHCRETIPQTIQLVRPWAKKGLTGVFHCFTGNVEQAHEITNMGFYLGIGGVATFKNGGLDQVIPSLDKEKVVLETDSPYLAPVPNRGKRNEPSYIKLVADRVAELWQTDTETVDQITTVNANRLFDL